MKSRNLILFCFLTATLAVNAQPLIRRAQKKMNLFNYSRAIELLHKAVEKPAYRDAAIPMLAECYRMQHDVEASRSWYEQAVALPDAKADWYLYYASALQANGDYQRAAEFFRKYAEMNPADQKSVVYIKQCELLMGEWKDIPPRFEVKSIQGINSKESDFGPALYANGFTFASDRGYIDTDDDTYGWTGRKYLNIYFARPKHAGEFFGEYREPYPMQGSFNQSFHDGPVSFAGDSLAMFTRSFRDRKAQKTGNIRTDYLKVYSSKRIRGDWQELEPFFLNSYGYSVGHPALTADGKSVVFASDMPGGQGGVDLWKCTKNAEGWSPPVNLGPEVNTWGNEMFPAFRNDGTLFFASDGLPGYGGLDIFSTYESKGVFSSPENIMAPINSSFDDFSIIWVPGTTYGMFSSNRPGGLGLDDIYAFKKLKGAPEEEKKAEVEELAAETEKEKQTETTIEKLPDSDIVIWGVVKDKDSRLPLEGAIVFILNERNDSVYIVLTDQDGIYRMRFDRASSFIVKATQKGWVPDCLSWQPDALQSGQENKASRDLLLSKLQVNKTFALENIYYDFDKAVIRPDAEPPLDKLINLMKENPISIELLSHTDCRGSFAYNDKLSLRRAESAANYLKSNGIEASRIQAKGFGEKQLSNRCADGVKCSEDEHQANRRTEFRITDTGKTVPDASQFDPLKFKSNNMIHREDLPADFFMQCGN